MPPHSFVSCFPRIPLLALGLAAMACTTSMQDSIMRDVIVERAQQRADFVDRPGLQVLVCGSSGPLSSPDRASTCVAVAAAGKIYIVDVGLGSSENLGAWAVPMDDVEGILLTHFHSDHISELGEYNLQTWAAGRDAPLPVYGPTGVDQVVDGFNAAYAQSREYRTAHHGADFLDPDVGLLAAHSFVTPADTPGASTVVLDQGGLVIRAFSVAHAPVTPAVGYRFDYEGRSVFITGDTSQSSNVVAGAKGVDVLLHDAMAHHMIEAAESVAKEQGRTRNERITHDIPEYHASVTQAAEVANEAGAELLVLYHLVPPPDNFVVKSVFLRGVDDVRPDGVVLSEDGLLLDLPPRSTEIRESILGG